MKLAILSGTAEGGLDFEVEWRLETTPDLELMLPQI